MRASVGPPINIFHLARCGRGSILKRLGLKESTTASLLSPDRASFAARVVRPQRLEDS